MNIRNARFRAALCAALLVAAPALVHAQQAQKPAQAAKPAPKPRSYASAEEAAKALVEAARAKNAQELLAIVGVDAKSWLSSGDAIADANDWANFVAAYDERNRLETPGEGRAILDVGNDDWPFPAPIVKRADGWAFDAAAGREEILNRRVGRNELDAMQTLLAISDAQREYAAADPDGNGYPDYARRITSTQGKKD